MSRDEIGKRRYMAKKIRKTSAERLTDSLIERYRNHLRENYASRLENQDAPRDNFEWCYSDKAINIWCYDNGVAAQDDNEEDEEDYIYLVWDGKEVLSYDDADTAYIDILSELRQQSSVRAVLYATSPLAVSALIAVLLAGIIGAMLLNQMKVPDPLWSIFTAVVAFYFGREGGARRAAETASDGHSI